MSTPITTFPDWTCTIHGKKMSEHVCIYCCLCYRSLTPEECHVTLDGETEDVCEECAAAEAEYLAHKELRETP